MATPSGRIVAVFADVEFRDHDLVQAILDQLHHERPILRLLHGAHVPADIDANRWAQAWRVPVIPYPPDFTIGPSETATDVRLRFMLEQEQPDLIVVFRREGHPLSVEAHAKYRNTPVLLVTGWAALFSPLPTATP